VTDAPRARLLRLVGFKELRKGALLGFATIEIAPGLTIVDCPLQSSGGRVWCAPPAKPVLGSDGRQVETNGKKQYVAILRWRDRAMSDRFSDRIVELVRQQYPGALP
jgi:hypothetical protein